MLFPLQQRGGKIPPHIQRGNLSTKMHLMVRSTPSLLSFPGGARGVDVIVVGNGHGDTSSNPGRDWLHFT